MIDPISDMLTRIRNAQMAGHASVMVPGSKLKLAIAKILERYHFIERFEIISDTAFSSLLITLKYVTISRTKERPAITEIKRVSREGQRIYQNVQELKPVKNGFGITIVSTSKGVMTGSEAKKLGVGGEIICTVW